MTAPFSLFNAEGPAPWVITCDHASNRVPEDLGGTLGLSAQDMARHIAYDIGADGVSRALAQALNAPAILSTFSRLVIDPNRGEDDPTLIMKLYDGTIIPANRHLDPAGRVQRLETLYRPYHAALADLLATRQRPVICSVHSFTPQLQGRAPRPWHVGVLYAGDDRLARPLIASLRTDPDLCVGVNEPYSGHLPGDAMDRHALGPGRPHVLIEIRNDLISDPETQRAWGHRLAPHLTRALEEVHHG